MIPPKNPRRKHAPGPALLEPWPDNDPEPVICPTCGQPWPLDRSALLDYVTLLQALACDLKAALERAVLP